MSTLGSLTPFRSLLAAGLVDRFRVGVFPVITGKTGRERIYDGYPDVALDMVTSRTFDGKIQLLEYVPTVLADPPGADAAPEPDLARPLVRISSAVIEALPTPCRPSAVARWAAAGSV